MRIIYYAADSDLQTSALSALCYRDWAREQLEKEFPGHDIEVSDEQSLYTCDTDDEELRDLIQEFCHQLWDTCPWDWVEDMV